MNQSNLQRNERLRHHLAAEYVLGTLRGGARRRFESWIARDPGLRTTVAEWERRLLPAAELVQPAVPPARVWSGIERRLGPVAQAPARGWLDSLAFWRGLGLAASAVALLLVSVLVMRQPAVTPAAAPVYIATLVDDANGPVLFVRGDAKQRTVTVHTLQPPQRAAGKSLELWALPKSGPPRSLGLIDAGGTITLRLPEDVVPQAVSALAVSVEPLGGSPNKYAPSGQVVYKGAWTAI